VNNRCFRNGERRLEEGSGEDSTSEEEVHSDCELTVSEDTLKRSFFEGSRVGLRPGEIGEVMGKDDEGRETSKSVDPVETVRSTDDDGGRGSGGRFRRSSESGRAGSEGSVRSSADECGVFLLVEVRRVGTSVTLFTGSDLGDGHVATHLATLVVRVAPVVVESDTGRVVGHSVGGNVISSDRRSSSGSGSERSFSVTTEV
jgi:hypothetical protein